MQVIAAVAAGLDGQTKPQVVFVQVIKQDSGPEVRETQDRDQHVLQIGKLDFQRAQAAADPTMDALNTPTIYDNKFDPTKPQSTMGMLLTPTIATSPANFDPAAVKATAMENAPRPTGAMPAPAITPAQVAVLPTATLARTTATILDPGRPMPPGVYNPPLVNTLHFTHPPSSASRGFSTKTFSPPAPTSTPKAFTTTTYIPHSTTAMHSHTPSTMHSHTPTTMHSHSHTTATHSHTSTTVVVVVTTTTVESWAVLTGHQPSAEPTVLQTTAPVAIPVTVDSFTETVASARPGSIPLMPRSTTKRKSAVNGDYVPWACLSLGWLVIAGFVVL